MAMDPNQKKPASPFGSRVAQRNENSDPIADEAPRQDPDPVEVSKEEAQEHALAIKKEFSIEVLEEPKPGPKIADYLSKATMDQLSHEQIKAMNTNVGGTNNWAEPVMVCRDHLCPYQDKCPLFKAKVPRPIGHDCPVELTMIRYLKLNLMNNLPPEDRGDPFIELQIDSLVVSILAQSRARTKWAIDAGDIEQDDVKGVDQKGNQIVGKVLHRALHIMKDFSKQEKELMAKLLATPQDRAKVDREGLHDRSKRAAELGDRIAAKIAEKKKKMRTGEVYIIERTEIQDAEYKVQDEE